MRYRLFLPPSNIIIWFSCVFGNANLNVSCKKSCNSVNKPGFRRESRVLLWDFEKIAWYRHRLSYFGFSAPFYRISLNITAAFYGILLFFRLRNTLYSGVLRFLLLRPFCENSLCVCIHIQFFVHIQNLRSFVIIPVVLYKILSQFRCSVLLFSPVRHYLSPGSGPYRTQVWQSPVDASR